MPTVLTIHVERKVGRLALFRRKLQAIRMTEGVGLVVDQAHSRTRKGYMIRSAALLAPTILRFMALPRR